MESVILKSENFISKSGILDTLMLSKLFKESNFTERQAEVMSEVLRISQEATANKASAEIKAARQETDESIDKKELTTKQDLSVTEKKLELQIEEVRSDLSLKIEKVRTDLSIKIEKVRSDLSIEIEKVRADLSVEIEKVRSEIQSSKVEIIKWTAGLLLAQTGLIFTLIKAFLH